MTSIRPPGSLPLSTPTQRNTETAAPAQAPQAPVANAPAAAPRAPVSAFDTGTPRNIARADVAPPPLDLETEKAQQAIDKSLAYLSQQGLSRGNAANAFSPRTVTTDELGMTHVRLDRVHNGIAVLGEQVISHLDQNNEVRNITGGQSVIPAELGTGTPAVSQDAALEIAAEAFASGAGKHVGGKTDENGVSVRHVIYQDVEGEYREGYVAEFTNLLDGDSPLRMNYIVDAQTGAIADLWNQIGGLDLEHLEQSAPVEVKVSDTPNLAIKDKTTIETKLTVTEDVSIDKLAVGLDIDHTWRGDLTIELTSPAGTTVTITDRQGGSQDDVKGEFDLSAFAGESAKGEWTLTVRDNWTRDEGTLNAWGLNILGTRAGEPTDPTDPTDPTEPTDPAGDDTSLYSGTVHLDTTQNSAGAYELKDPSRGKGVVTLDAENKYSASNPVAITDDNDIWGEATDNRRHDAAVDAHYGAQMTYDFYRDILGRDSIDGKGEVLQSNVHIRTNYVNAFWDGRTMNYGDGDGRTAGPLTTLDIAGHEISHGLTERTAGLIYRGESGGINESMSDIMGTGVEWYAAQRNPAVQFDWLVGEDAWTPGNGNDDALRYMDDPTRDNYSIDHYSNYPRQTEVHGSSGIMNNAFYLLAEGGTNKTSGMSVANGIGVEDSLKIFGRALIHYMTPSTTFSQARAATINAATDLYGADSQQVASLKEAWSAVGVE
ncbi:MAG TPA: M4 family metallopeptidase [Myxococcaceae bacterium]|nr:M4 family metallopeptidase [Myxococcaceae bacterium]